MLSHSHPRRTSAEPASQELTCEFSNHSSTICLLSMLRDAKVLCISLNAYLHENSLQIDGIYFTNPSYSTIAILGGAPKSKLICMTVILSEAVIGLKANRLTSLWGLSCSLKIPECCR